MRSNSPTIGHGAADADLGLKDLREILHPALSDVAKGSKVLAIIPDKTRDDNTHQLFPMAAEILAANRVETVDALVAQGTHVPMTDAEKRRKIGWDKGASIPLIQNIYDHKWDRPDELVNLGDLSADRIGDLTEGILSESVSVTLNKLLAPGVYDTVLIFGATVPHEVAGFSGGAKYFFPGVAGAEFTHATHWLGALASIENVIGRVETPTRRMIEAAADLVPAQIISLNSVVSRQDDGRLRTHGLFCGDHRTALRQAAEVSRQVHIRYTGRKYKRVVALLDEHYDELWVGGKASYKLGGVIEEGGELIIYAPHLKTVSETHGRMIERYGYAPLDRVREMVALSDELRSNLAVAAHLAHVSFGSRIDPATDKVVPRYRIVMASALDEETCRRINLGYADHGTFSLSDYRDDDTLIVERAGRDLYLVEER